jgi:ABC-type Fe3+/spermidine/putrescine transport system ATPase subunit
MTLLELSDVRKSFTGASKQRTVALESMNLKVDEGEFVALLGASGCGKTTTLRSIAGLETPDSGEIVIGGKPVFSTKSARTVFVPPERRNLGMVFQSYALWPHMTVTENIAFGLAKRGLDKSEIAAKIERSLKAVRMWELRERRISQLSGGQQQRVAVARAIAPEPRIILFDEPLSNIDARLRESLRMQVLDIQSRMNLTAIWVTHDQDEALSLASRIVLMNNGVVEQVGSPEEVWDHPATPFAADFIGSACELNGVVTSADSVGTTVSLGGGFSLELPPTSPPRVIGTPLRLFVRSDSVRVIGAADDAVNTWNVPVKVSKFHGDYTMVSVLLGEQELRFRTATRLDRSAEQLRLAISAKDVLVYADSPEISPAPAHA